MGIILRYIVVTLTFIFISSPIFALNLAGDLIDNNAQIQFSVDNVNNTVMSPVVSFAIDRKLDLVVQSQLNTPLSVQPGTHDAALPFTVTNLSNAPIGVLFSAKTYSGLATGSESYNTNIPFIDANHKAYVDVNNNNLYEPAIDTEQFIAELAPSANKTVFIVTDMPSSNITFNDFAAVTLVAQVATTGTVGIPGSAVAISNDDAGNISPAGQYEDGSSSSAGSMSTSSKRENMLQVLDIYTDAAGVINSAGAVDTVYNGQHSDSSGYIISTSTVVIAKSAQVLDNANNTITPYAGAVIRYSLIVSAGAPSSQILVSDIIPNGTHYKAGSLKLDSVSLSDSTDGDVGHFLSTPSVTASKIEVFINLMNTGDSHQIEFDVIIE